MHFWLAMFRRSTSKSGGAGKLHEHGAFRD
jgi:hypothetical protein